MFFFFYYFLRVHCVTRNERTPHARTDGTVDGCDSLRTLHTRWCYYYASGSLKLLCHLFYFFIFIPPPHEQNCLLDQSHITGFPICEPPPPPSIPPKPPLYLNEGPKMFQKSSFFFTYPSNVRNKGVGGVDVIGWVWVRVVCDVVKRA